MAISRWQGSGSSSCRWCVPLDSSLVPERLSSHACRSILVVCLIVLTGTLCSMLGSQARANLVCRASSSALSLARPPACPPHLCTIASALDTKKNKYNIYICCTHTCLNSSVHSALVQPATHIPTQLCKIENDGGYHYPIELAWTPSVCTIP